MHILFITNATGTRSGWERYSRDLITSFIKKGNTVTVVCSALENPEDRIPGVKYISCLPGPLQFKRNFFLSYLYTKKILANINTQEKPDIVHCIVEPYACIAKKVAQMLGKPYIITLHGSYAVKTLQNPLYRFLQLRAYAGAQKLISISHYTKYRLEKYNKLLNIVVIPNGVQAELVHSQLPTMRNQKKLLGVGAVKHRKGYHIVLEALVLVKKIVPDFVYTIVGSQSDTEYVNQLKKYCTENNLENNVDFRGSISSQDLETLYNQARAFVLMPVSDTYNFEGFGLVYLEANARGVPVIGSRDSGAEEAIQDSVSGYLIQPASTQELADKIALLLTNQEKRQHMSEGALEWAKAHTWDKIIDQYLHVYSETRDH